MRALTTLFFDLQIANASDEVLLMYNDQAYSKLVELMKNERGTASPNSNLLYHLNLLRLLTLCTEGKNVNTEMKCHSLLPLDEIVKIVTDDDCIPEVLFICLWVFTCIYL